VKVQAKEGKGLFAIQIGAFTEDLNAVRLKEALSLKYDNVYIEEAEIKGTIYHRVRIGIFKSFSSAWAVAETMGQEGYQTIIIKTDVRI
jgi:rare lipoprotein A